MLEKLSKTIKGVVDIARHPDATIETDFSECLPSWLKTFSDAYDKEEPVILSVNASAALYHVLLCADARTKKLVKERNDAQRKN